MLNQVKYLKEADVILPLALQVTAKMW